MSKPICLKEIQINAPAEKVWEIIKDPMNLHYMPVVLNVEVRENRSLRVVTIDTRENPQYGDTLIALERCYDIDHVAHRYRYTYEGPDLPVTDHVATVEIIATGPSSCTFRWSCVWTLTEPLTSEEEGQMARAVEGMWWSGMTTVKSIAEAA